jgi:hypothetical protein
VQVRVILVRSFLIFFLRTVALPQHIKFQKKSEVETGWKLPDAVPYVTETLRDAVAEVQRKYEDEIRPPTVVTKAEASLNSVPGFHFPASQCVYFELPLPLGSERKKEKRKSSDEPAGRKKKKSKKE